MLFLLGASAADLDGTDFLTILDHSLDSSTDERLVE